MRYKGKALGPEFFARKVQEVAPDLIGCSIFTTIDGKRAGGVIIETEAYDEDDPACHCHPLAAARRRSHSAPMKHIGGHAYVHSDRQMWCLNITCDREGFGSAVLIRAIRPTVEIEIMTSRRASCEKSDRRIKQQTKGYERVLCNGPSKLCEALGITDELNGLSVFDDPFELYDHASSIEIQNGERINISRATTTRWRWGLVGAQGYLSKKFG